jgi:hypothetical protein
MCPVAKKRRTVLRGGLLLLCALSLTACNSERRPNVESSTTNVDWLLEQRNPRDSLVLVAIPSSDTAARGGPIRLAYFIRNDGVNPASLRHDNLFIDFDVIAPSGSIASKIEATVNLFVGAVAEVTLPPGGILGQRVDLTCMTFLYSPADAPCYHQFVFQETGEYRVVVRYSPPPLPPEAIGRPIQRSGTKWQPLSSDTIRFIVR